MSSLMEVDSETPEPYHSQILQPAFTLPPTAQSPLVHPLIDDFAAFNELMNEWSSGRLRIERAGDDPKEQEKEFTDILLAVTGELGSKAKFIGPLLRRDATTLIKDLNDDELKEFKEGVKAGVYENNWARLGSHRTFYFISY